MKSSQDLFALHSGSGNARVFEEISKDGRRRSQRENIGSDKVKASER